MRPPLLRLALGSSALLCLTLAGCALRGPDMIKEGRGFYNEAIQQTNNEQLLLNLVRLKYGDTPMFLELASISTSMTIGTGASLQADAIRRPGFGTDRGAGFLGAGASYSWSETPTVTFSPLQGEAFVTQMLSPLTMSELLLLANSGWEPEVVLRLCVHSINGIPNAPTAAGPTPELQPQFEDFLTLVLAMDRLSDRGLLEISEIDPADAGGEAELDLRIMAAAEGDPDTVMLQQLLGIEPGMERYSVRAGVLPDEDDEIAIETRSLLSCLSYLSQSIDVPSHHRERGYVRTTRAKDGGEFDWGLLFDDLLDIRNAESRPPDAMTSVYYRDTWYYIDAADLDSKATFSLLAQVFALHAGDLSSEAPVLTIPISGG